jgi:hypothetical protein
MRRVAVLLLLAGLALAGEVPTAAVAAPTPTPSPTALAPSRGVNVQPAPKTAHRSKSGTFLELGTVKLGVAVTDTLVLRSTFDVPTVVDVYPADAQPAVGGGFGFSARKDARKQVGAWLKLSSARLTVPPQGAVTFRSTVTVPRGTQGGEYVGAVIAEPVDQGPGGAVQTRTRFAMAVYLTVPGGATGAKPGRGKPDGTLVVLGVTPRFDGNRSCPVAKLRNDSQTIVDPKVTVRTKGWFGSGSSYSRTRSAALLPEATASVALPCIKRPIGPGSVRVELASPKGEGARAIDYVWLPTALLVALLFLLLMIGALLTTFVRGVLRRPDGAAGESSAVRPPA